MSTSAAEAALSSNTPDELGAKSTQVILEGSGGDALAAILMRREKVVISPIPPPEELERYREISPEIVDTWLQTWRLETRWRQRYEDRLLWMDFVPRVLGQLFGFSLGAGALWASTEMVLAGAEASGVATVIGAVGGLLAAFVIGKKSTHSKQSSENEPGRDSSAEST